MRIETELRSYLFQLDASPAAAYAEWSIPFTSRAAVSKE